MSKLRTANLMAALTTALGDRLERVARDHPNATNSAAAALNIIGFDEGCSNGALAEALGLSHAATVRLVDKLEAAGLVTSGAGTDRRAVALRLTPAGRERAAEVVGRRVALVAETLDILSDAQRAALTGIATTLLDAMTQTPADGNHLCRLCDGTSCPEDCCPVHLKALALAG
jgi:MarR family transcriptional repressor of emrRAB